jgi:hypothetical protein
VATALGGSGERTLAISIYRVPGIAADRLLERFASVIVRPGRAAWHDRAVDGRRVSRAEGNGLPERVVSRWRTGRATGTSSMRRDDPRTLSWRCAGWEKASTRELTSNGARGMSLSATRSRRMRTRHLPIVQFGVVWAIDRARSADSCRSRRHVAVGDMYAVMEGRTLHGPGGAGGAGGSSRGAPPSDSRGASTRGSSRDRTRCLVLSQAGI